MMVRLPNTDAADAAANVSNLKNLMHNPGAYVIGVSPS